MEYAIIEIGGHQIWIEKGQHFITNKILTDKGSELNPGSKINIKRILLVKKKNDIQFGHPYLINSIVQAQILEHLRGSKLTVYKMKSKKKYRRKKGHRQEMTKLIINQIKI